MPKVGKPTSKRQPVRLRHKIEKASAAKQRKERRKAKADPTWRTRLKKDPGIPNLFPFKEKILQEIEQKKQAKEEDAQRRREEAKARRNGIVGEAAAEVEEEDADQLRDFGSDDEGEGVDMEVDESNPMAALLASARARAVDYAHAGAEDGEAMDEDDDEEWAGVEEDETNPTTTGLSGRGDSSRKAFDKIFQQVVEQADVVLYVLDARDPEGTRSKEVERQIMSAAGGSKRLILILNKIDLIPPPTLKAWLAHLRRYFPTLPIRASMGAPNAKTFDHKQLTVKGTSEALFKALKSYAQSKSLKRSISVGVIGYPNTGKSSIINALTSRMGRAAGACPVGAEAGVTTSLREVKLDNKLKLLDSPGIVFPTASNSSKENKSEEQARLILLNAVPPKDMDDPMPAVTLLLKRLATSEEMFTKLLKVYDLPPLMSMNGDVTKDFLIQVARKRGRLGKGGVPNLHSSAQAVITDWRDGRIQGWMDAPVLKIAPANAAPEDVAEGVDQKKIVKEWAEEFKLEGLWGDSEPAVEETTAMQA
ncbi:putative nucleolar gtp-binding protein 2 [Venturia nashicola]|nr:putative nucleolar gtp-binding protein 2 [Venturia nashicola]